MEIREIRPPARKLGTKANFEHDKAIAKKAPNGRRIRIIMPQPATNQYHIFVLP
jgi:hypothetical protein